MSEYSQIIEAINRTRKSGRKSALATVVSVQGSAYRREGAKMLVDQENNIFGTISGGCLESDVAEIAKYHLDEDLVWGLGLGCPGTVKIYIEPVEPVNN